MSGNPARERAPNAEPFDPIAAFLDLKLRKKGPLVELKKADDGVPVYFIHELTGNVSCYHYIVEAIEGPAFGIQVPPNERRTSTISTIEDLSSKYVELIVAKTPHGPICLVGWSAGATIALEVARQLTSIGRQPGILINIDQPIDNAKGIVSPHHSFLENLYYWLCNEPKRPLHKFASRLVAKVGETVTAVTGRQPAAPVRYPKNSVDKARSPEEADFYRKFYHLLFAYIPPRSYSGQVLSFVASENENPDRLVKSWKSIAPNCQFVPAPGDHDAMVKKGPGVIEVREHIRRAISELPTTPRLATCAEASASAEAEVRFARP
ncbi:MAG TPA: thioesterase domain-containing protein [Caulobacteraceae bacterium]|nr:thioesterase domain-containing protein [Caulobacteraceae bacterium]